MKKISLIFASLILTVGIAMAQVDPTATHTVSITVPDVSLIGISADYIELNPVAPTIAGETFTAPEANSELYLYLTSIVASEDTRKVTVEMTGELSEALSVTVEASPAASGNGALGNTVETITLTDDPVDIITEIGSGYTGRGSGAGFNLTYNLVIDNTKTANLLATNSNLTVTYTMIAQ